MNPATFQEGSGGQLCESQIEKSCRLITFVVSHIVMVAR
jgi:hypothetical protein